MPDVVVCILDAPIMTMVYVVFAANAHAMRFLPARCTASDLGSHLFTNSSHRLGFSRVVSELVPIQSYSVFALESRMKAHALP